MGVCLVCSCRDHLFLLLSGFPINASSYCINYSVAILYVLMVYCNSTLYYLTKCLLIFSCFFRVHPDSDTEKPWKCSLTVQQPSCTLLCCVAWSNIMAFPLSWLSYHFSSKEKTTKHLRLEYLMKVKCSLVCPDHAQNNNMQYLQQQSCHYCIIY